MVKPKEKLDIRLEDYFYLDEENTLRWKQRYGRMCIGDLAGKNYNSIHKVCFRGVYVPTSLIIDMLSCIPKQVATSGLVGGSNAQGAGQSASRIGLPDAGLPRQYRDNAPADWATDYRLRGLSETQINSLFTRNADGSREEIGIIATSSSSKSKAKKAK